MQSDLLTLVREAAQRWAAAAGALLTATGIAGLATGAETFRKLDAGWPEIGGLLVGVGVCAGVLGLWKASEASVVRFQDGLISADALRRHEQSAFRDARAQLTCAQRATAVAIIALLGAAIVLWAAPREPPKSTFISGRTEDGDQLCGKLAGADATALVVDDKGNGRLLSDLDRVRAVERCPPTR